MPHCRECGIELRPGDEGVCPGCGADLDGGTVDDGAAASRAGGGAQAGRPPEDETARGAGPGQQPAEDAPPSSPEPMAAPQASGGGYDRRRVLGYTALGAVLGGLGAGGFLLLQGSNGSEAATGGSAESGSPNPTVTETQAGSNGADFGGYLAGTGNFDGHVEDFTGHDHATVHVGVEANNGYYGFGEPAIVVDPGTTVIWVWTGRGGSHSVTAEDGSFESKLTSNAEYTYKRTFEETGVHRYFCPPHKPLGMKGVVAVEEPGGNHGVSS